MRRAAALITLVVAAACGDNGATAVDAGRADARVPPPDAGECELDFTHAERVELLDFDLHLELSGAGTRCEQVIAALPQLIDQLAGVDRLLAGPHTTHCDEFETQVYLAMGPPPAINGIELRGMTWLVELFVLLPSGDAWMQGSFFEIVDLPGGCLGEVDLIERMPGNVLSYVELANCSPSGLGTYTIAAGDAYAMGDDVFTVEVISSSAWISRRRYVDVFLLPSHIDDPIRFSDLNCCDTSSLLNCVGARVLVSTGDGSVDEQLRRCECQPSP
jgi:hypothetical protein